MTIGTDHGAYLSLWQSIFQRCAGWATDGASRLIRRNDLGNQIAPGDRGNLVFSLRCRFLRA